MTEIAQLKQQLADAHGYATRLAISLHAKYAPEVTQWKPLDDVLGVLTQIDNAVTGIEADARVAQHAECVRLLRTCDGWEDAADFLEQHKPGDSHAKE